MLIALIGDIHGNLPALRAVLDDIDNMGIQTVLNTGDTVVGYPWPNEVVDLIRQRNIPSVQGEKDRLASTFLRKAKQLRNKLPDDQYAPIEWTFEQLGSSNLEYLAGLPRQRRLTLEGIDLVLCHGTPGGGQTDSLLPDDDDEKFRRQREVANTPLIICGGTHSSFGRQLSDSYFADPGSVGQPQAVYTLLNTEETDWTTETRRIDYDYPSVLQRLTALNLPIPKP
jgi:putative phosphoesterase